MYHGLQKLISMSSSNAKFTLIMRLYFQALLKLVKFTILVCDFRYTIQIITCHVHFLILQFKLLVACVLTFIYPQNITSPCTKYHGLETNLKYSNSNKRTNKHSTRTMFVLSSKNMLSSYLIDQLQYINVSQLTSKIAIRPVRKS